MDYAEAHAAFFQPRAGDAPPARTDDLTSPARRLRDAIEPLAMVWIWAEKPNAAYAEHGMDFLSAYVRGRGCVLGEAEGTVVASSFGVFEPGVIAALWDAGRAACTVEDMRALKEGAAVEVLRDVLGEPAELAQVVTALRRATDAADPTGRPLHAGLTALPWPADPLGQLWHACSILREHRGDGHLAAVVAAGFDGVEANILTELFVGWNALDYTATRAWSPEVMQAAMERLRARGLVDGDQLSEKGRHTRSHVEDSTDRTVQRAVDAIGDELSDVVPLLDGWARRLVDAGAFPPDPYKRAAG